MIDDSPLFHAIWRKSSRSGRGEECVEVAAFPAATVGIRDSKDTGGPALAIGAHQFRALLDQVKAGTLDR